MLDNGYEIPALAAVIGFHITMMVDDIMHDDCLGVRMELVGGALLSLIDRGYFGPPPAAGSWKERLDTQLGVASGRNQIPIDPYIYIYVYIIYIYI